MSEQTIFSIATIVIALAALYGSVQSQRYIQKRNTKQDDTAELAELQQSIVRLERAININAERISKIEGISELSWKILEIYAGKTLHRDEDDLQIDYYLDNYENLTAPEAQSFVDCLHQIAEDRDTADGTKMAATIKLAAVIRRYGPRYGLTLPNGNQASLTQMMKAITLSE